MENWWKYTSQEIISRSLFECVCANWNDSSCEQGERKRKVKTENLKLIWLKLWNFKTIWSHFMSLLCKICTINRREILTMRKQMLKQMVILLFLYYFAMFFCFRFMLCFLFLHFFLLLRCYIFITVHCNCDCYY